MININMTKAKDVWRNKIRAERNTEFSKLDVEYMRALESGDTTLQNNISTKKQALRDAPEDPRIENATTPEDLKNLDIIGEIVT